MKKKLIFNLLIVLILTSCSAVTTPTNLRLTDQPIAQLRMMQTRHFEQSDSTLALQAIIKTLANLDFQIVRVDNQSDLVEAIRLENNNIMQANVTVRTSLSSGSLVRIVLRYNQYFVVSEQTYQEFFESLSHNMI